MRRYVSRALAALLVPAAGAGLMLGAAGASARLAVAGPLLAWGRCPAGVAVTARTAVGTVVHLECATVRVPLDYRDPGGRQISIAVSRLRSPGRGSRRGVLVLNPGGPGGSGLAYPLEFASAAPQGVLSSYDLIGFDPRGVGHSDPVTCGLTFRQALQVTAPWPRPGGAAGDIDQNAALAHAVADLCAAWSGGQLRFITTANTARDMDRIRAALGVSKISYYGISYGSYLGAVYASLFPWHTDRVVLDSVTDPAGVWRQSGFRVAGPGVEARFPDLTHFIAHHRARYHLGATSAQVRAAYFALTARLGRRPLRTPAGALTEDLFRDVAFSAMYSDQAFPITARLWQAARTKDVDAVARLGRQIGLWDTSFGPVAENSVAADLAVICDDAAWPRSVSRYQRDVRHDARRYPVAGGLAANIWPCAFWPYRPAEPPVQVTGRGPRNMLLVNNLRDPVTPFSGALAARREFGQRARIVGVDQGGHGVYLINPNACGSATVTRYLAYGILPPHDRTCPATHAGRARHAAYGEGVWLTRRQA